MAVVPPDTFCDVHSIPPIFTSRPNLGPLRLLNISTSETLTEKIPLINIGRSLRRFIENYSLLPPWIPSSAAFILLCPWMEVPEVVILDDWILSMNPNMRQLVSKVLVPYEKLNVLEVKQCFDLLLTSLISQPDFPLKVAEDELKNAFLRLAWQETYLGQFLAISQMRMGFLENGQLPVEDIWKGWIAKFQNGLFVDWSNHEATQPSDPQKFEKRMQLALNRSIKMEENAAKTATS